MFLFFRSSSAYVLKCGLLFQTVLLNERKNETLTQQGNDGGVVTVEKQGKS